MGLAVAWYGDGAVDRDGCDCDGCGNGGNGCNLNAEVAAEGTVDSFDSPFFLALIATPDLSWRSIAGCGGGRD